MSTPSLGQAPTPGPSADNPTPARGRASTITRVVRAVDTLYDLVIFPVGVGYCVATTANLWVGFGVFLVLLVLGGIRQQTLVKS